MDHLTIEAPIEVLYDPISNITITRWTKESEVDERYTIFESQLNRVVSTGILPEIALSVQIS
jgi:hypothetical protein